MQPVGSHRNPATHCLSRLIRFALLIATRISGVLMHARLNLSENIAPGLFAIWASTVGCVRAACRCRGCCLRQFTLDAMQLSRWQRMRQQMTPGHRPMLSSANIRTRCPARPPCRRHQSGASRVGSHSVSPAGVPLSGVKAALPQHLPSNGSGASAGSPPVLKCNLEADSSHITRASFILALTLTGAPFGPPCSSLVGHASIKCHKPLTVLPQQWRRRDARPAAKQREHAKQLAERLDRQQDKVSSCLCNSISGTPVIPLLGGQSLFATPFHLTTVTATNPSVSCTAAAQSGAQRRQAAAGRRRSLGCSGCRCHRCR